MTKNRCVPAPGAGHEAVDGAAPESCGRRSRHISAAGRARSSRISEMGCGAWRLDKFSWSLFDGRLSSRVCAAALHCCRGCRAFRMACREALFLISEMGCSAWRLYKFSRSLFDGRLTPKFTSLLQCFMRLLPRPGAWRPVRFGSVVVPSMTKNCLVKVPYLLQFQLAMHPSTKLR